MGGEMVEVAPMWGVALYCLRKRRLWESAFNITSRGGHVSSATSRRTSSIRHICGQQHNIQLTKLCRKPHFSTFKCARRGSERGRHFRHSEGGARPPSESPPIPQFWSLSMHMLPYANEPYDTFTTPAALEEMRNALHSVRAQFGQTYPMVIGGKKVMTDALLTSTNPSAPSEVVGKSARATREHAEAALNAAWTAFDSWKLGH